MDNILDDKHFEICIYDKKFYLSTLFLVLFLGNEFQTMSPQQFYILAAGLCFYGEDLLIQYCEMAKNPTVEIFKKFLKSVIHHRYKEISSSNNPLIIFANKILTDKNYDYWIKNILSYESYDNPNYVNVINLNCLSELILALKCRNNLSNSKVKIHHDRIDGYDRTFISELSNFNIDLNFVDSKKEELIQIADNAVSIFSKCINEVFLRFKEKREWDLDIRWIMEQYTKVLTKVSITNIKFVIPLQNWAVSLCVNEMFNKNYPIEKRINFYFNLIYSKKSQIDL